MDKSRSIHDTGKIKVKSKTGNENRAQKTVTKAVIPVFDFVEYFGLHNFFTDKKPGQEGADNNMQPQRFGNESKSKGDDQCCS